MDLERITEVPEKEEITPKSPIKVSQETTPGPLKPVT
jgi:hypothetical protein